MVWLRCRASAQHWLLHFHLRAANVEMDSAASVGSAVEALEASMKLAADANLPSAQVCTRSSHLCSSLQSDKQADWDAASKVTKHCFMMFGMLSTALKAFPDRSIEHKPLALKPESVNDTRGARHDCQADCCGSPWVLHCARKKSADHIMIPIHGQTARYRPGVVNRGRQHRHHERAVCVLGAHQLGFQQGADSFAS